MTTLDNSTDLFPEAEAKYRGIFENAVEGIFQSTPSGTFITANSALARILGYESPAELMATITDIQAQLYVEPEHRPEVTQLLEENDRQRFEVELYRKDRSTVWVSGNVRAVRDTQGQLLYYEGMVEDISQRKRAEEELQRRADEFAALYDTARDLATQQDFSTLAQAIVERALSLLNLPIGGIFLYDPTQGDLELVFAKKGLVPLGTRIPFGEGITGRVAQSRQPLIINDFPTWKLGSPWVAGVSIKSLISVPMLSGGELIGVLSVGEDRAERKFTDADARLLSLFAAQAASAIRNMHLLEETRTRAEQLAISEARTRLIVDSAYDAFIALDANGLITDWNHQAEVTFGWSREEAMGRFLAGTIIQTQRREAHQRGLGHFLATGEGQLLNRRIEATALHRDGHEFPVELTITPIYWKDSFIFSAFVHDITERKQAEEAAKESEERQRLAFEAAKIGTGEMDLQTHQITLSDALQRVVGLAPSTFNLTFEEYAERIHPEDRARLCQVVEDAKAGQSDIAIDYRIVWQDGSIHWTTSRAKAFYDEAGQPIRIVAALIDITERKQAEEALRQAHQDYVTLVNSIDGIVWEADAQTFTFNFVSQQAERLLGYPVERWLTEPTFWKDHIHPDDQEWAINFCVEATGEKRPHDFEYRMLAADGRVVWLRDIVTVVIENDQAIRLRGVMVDITENKRAEALRAGQRQVLEMIATSAPLEEVLVSLTRLIESQSEGMLCSILFLEDDGQHVRHGAAPSLPEAYTKAIDGAPIGPRAGSCGTAMYRGEPVIVTDIHHDPLWDDYRHLAAPYGLRACWSTPIISSQGEALGSFAMYYHEVRSPSPAETRLTDIAVHIAGIAIERKRAEEELLKHREHLEELVAERTEELAVAKDRAEEADRLKSAFLATMSHELRTPLNSIIGFTGIMLQGLAGPLNDEQQKQLNMVKSSARHLLDLINDVLDLSKIEAGQVELQLEPFDMRALIDKTVQTLGPLADKKKLELIADVAPEVDEVNSDRRRVEQILINLVNNAIKFTEKGQVRIECRVGKGQLLTSVVDTGIGIKPEDMGKLFTTFRQLDSTLARKHKGTGLGLAICQKLADLLGGEIQVESVWGEGCKFTLILPLNRQGE